MNNKCYFPQIKTTPAELKAYYNLSPERKIQTCPILELTKGIKGKMEGQLNRIKTYIGEDECFILDLTRDTTFQDASIKDMQNMHQEGYRKWREFLEQVQFENLIPSLVGSFKHLDDFTKQIKFFDKYFNGKFAYRIPIALNDDIQDLKIILEQVLLCNVNNSDNVYLILDFKSIAEHNIEAFSRQINDIKIVLEEVAFQGFVLPMFSSYPQIPPSDLSTKEKCGFGEMPLVEYKLREIILNSGLKFVYSDYGFIQPERKSSGGGLWYPRIDFPTSDKCYWVRYYNKTMYKDDNFDNRVKTEPSNEEAYKNIAEIVVEKEWYQLNKIPCWGTEQIENASQNEIEGKSPQYWIAVRSNIHMSRIIDTILLSS